MQNPILQMLKNTMPANNNLNQIRNMFNMVRSSRNPQTMLQNMMNNNPQMKQIMDIVRQSGGDPKTAFYKMAKEKGVDPNSVLSMLK